MPDLRPEDSAQGSTARPNPLVEATIGLLMAKLGDPRLQRVCDQGAGRLRHFDLLAKTFGCVYAVDTRRQLLRPQELYGVKHKSVCDVLVARHEDWGNVRALSAAAFAVTRLELDAVICACVYDVVPPQARVELAEAAYRNLRTAGLYSVIVPRNDASILHRCHPENAYEDGYTFTRGSSTTFYANFRSIEPLVSVSTSAGFQLLENRSVFRQVWLLLEKCQSTPAGQGPPDTGREATPARR
jgi:hypothetical protein